VPITVSLLVHSSDWSAAEYVSSHPPQETPTSHTAPALAPAAAAGSSGGPNTGSSQAQGSAGPSGVTLSAQATKQADGVVRVRGWSVDTGDGHVRGLPQPFASGAYDVVLQEQVRFGGHCCPSSFPARKPHKGHALSRAGLAQRVPNPY
jgi:hypothetical protein